MTRFIDRRSFLRNTLSAAAVAALPWPVAAAHAGRETLTAFLDAVRAGDVDKVRVQLDAEPKLIWARDAAGRSGFALALLHRHPEVATLLRERGHTPDLVEAALELDWPLFEQLAAQTPRLIDVDHPAGGPALWAAAYAGAGSQIFRPYQFGADPNVVPRRAGASSALLAALAHPDGRTAELTAAYLLGNGANAKRASSDGETPLHAAARRDLPAIVEMVLRKGADPGSRDEKGRTPLEVANVARAHAAEEMLGREAEIPRDHSTSRFAYDVEGRPYAPPDLSAHSLVERARVVADAHTKLDETRAAVEGAPELAHAVATTTEAAVEGCTHVGRRPIVDLLLSRGAPYSLPTAVFCGDLARARQLLDEDPLRIHERGPHDFALLWYPIIGGGRVELAELLLTRGAEVERQHFLGTTALHFAALGGQIEMATLLLDHGADPNRVGRKFDPAGQTPSAIAESRGNAAMLELLRARGARG